MRKLLFIAATFFLLSSSKCKKDTVIIPEGKLSFNIKAMMNNTPLIFNKIYAYNGKKIKFTKLSFFISDVDKRSPVFGSAAPTILDSKIALFDFSELTDSVGAVKGIAQFFPIIVGQKTKINFGIGVSAINNGFKPKDFPSSNPLSDAGYYWDDWKSYIFLKLEGLMDKDGDGRFESGITLHTGGNETYTLIGFPIDFEVKEGQTTTLNFFLDLNKLLTGIDLTTINATHQTGDLPTMKKFMGNFPTALTLK